MNQNKFRILTVGALLFAPSLLFAEAENEKYIPCSQGPGMLRQVDAWEGEAKAANIRQSGKLIAPETLAERLIGDCSQQLSLLSAAAQMSDDSSGRAIVNAWQTNLDFMKWWLQNRQSKASLPKSK